MQFDFRDESGVHVFEPNRKNETPSVFLEDL